MRTQPEMWVIEKFIWGGLILGLLFCMYCAAPDPWDKCRENFSYDVCHYALYR